MPDPSAGRKATQQPRPDGRYDCCPEGDISPCPERFVGHTVPCNAPYCSLHAASPPASETARNGCYVPINNDAQEGT